MTDTPAQIDIWCRIASETQNLEFKEVRNQYDTTKLCRYCIAIANEGGGHLVLGIAGKPPSAVVGSQAFPDTQDIAEKLFHWAGFRVGVEVVAHPDGRVVVFSIPAGPKGMSYQHDGAYLMRSGEELVPMSEDQLRKIFAEGKPCWLESPSLEDASEQDVVQLLDTQTFFDLMRLPYPANQKGVLARLQYVLRNQMTNQSLRVHFGLPEGSSNTFTQIITATMEEGLVKSDPDKPGSRRYARYMPVCA